jgi:hypothetical protein
MANLKIPDHHQRRWLLRDFVPSGTGLPVAPAWKWSEENKEEYVKTGDLTPHLDAWQAHIEMLAGSIGPRGSTTANERLAAEYCHAVMQNDLGLAARMEHFCSAQSLYRVHLLVGLSIIAAFLVYPLGGRVTAILAALLAVNALASECLEMLFRDNPLRRLLRRGISQNVVATIAPTDTHYQDLILMGHLDSNRTPLVFRSLGWVNLMRVFNPAAFAGIIATTILYVLGAITGWTWAWPVTAPVAFLCLLLVLIMWQADRTPFSPGANDNASGAAFVLALGRYLREHPLRHTRVWLANTGCEEVKHYGAIDFYNRHWAEMVNPHALVFEMLGCAGPAWLEKESILPTFAYRADPGLVSILEEISSSNSHLKAHPVTVSMGHSEQADALRIGIPAVCLIGLPPGGIGWREENPRLYWHQAEDTPDKIDREVLARTFGLTVAFMQSLDARADGHVPRSE